MLIRFIVSNYLSFKEETEFNMLTGSVRRKKEHVYTHNNIELLKTAAIYGANGAGKSNLIRAILLLKEVIINEKGIKEFRFETFRLSAEMKKKPTQFQVEFIYKNQIYDYGLAVFNGKIVEEWLYKIQDKKEELIYERTLKEGNIKIKAGKSLLSSQEDTFRFKLYEEELLSDEQTLLGMLSRAKKVKPVIEDVFDWFENSLNILDPSSIDVTFAVIYYRIPQFKTFVDNILQTFNTGIKKLVLKTVNINRYFGIDDIETINHIKHSLLNDKKDIEVIDEFDSNFFAFAVKENGKIVVKRLVAIHEGENREDIEFELSEESDGTQRLMDFIYTFFTIVFSQDVAFIDEIDQSIHPHLLKKLIAKFVNDKDSKGQLIFTTHDSNLLDQNIFRQDEIWLTEKNKAGETTFYPLSDFKIRYDLDIEKGYLNGRFGAIPFLGSLDDLNWRTHAS